MSRLNKTGNYFVADNAVILGSVEISEGSSIWYGCSIRGDVGTIKIGKFTNIQDNSVIHTDTDTHLSIGDYVTIGHAAIIHCESVGSYSLIGMGAILLAGARIGENCLIAAGCLVRENQIIPDNSIYMGVPAKQAGNTNEGNRNDHKERAQLYHQLAIRHENGLVD